MRTALHNFIGALLLIGLLAPAGVAFATIYSAGSLLQTGDVKSVHILDGTILDADVSGYAKISATKVSPRGTQGTLLLTDGTNIATTTLLTLSTTTGTFTVNATTTLAATTTINGVRYTWPSSQGTSGTALQNDGSGNLSWGVTTPAKLESAFTAGETLVAGQVVAIGDGSGATAVANEGVSGYDDDTSSIYYVRKITTTSSAVGISEVGVNLGNNSGSGSFVWTAEAVLYADNSGSPGTLSCSFGSASGSQGAATTFTVTVNNGTGCAVSPSTTYWVGIHFTSTSGGLRRTGRGGAGTTNYKLSSDGSSWGAPIGSLAIDYTWATNISGLLYGSSAAQNNFRFQGVVGILPSACAKSATCYVDTVGFTTATTSLTINTTYYVANATGTLSTSAGTNSRKFGTAFGTAGFMVNWDNR